MDGMGASSRSGEGITAVFQQAGTTDGQIIASKCFMLLEYTQKIEVRTGSVREKARTTGGVKSVQPPSPEEATPLGETPCCGEPAKVDGTTPLGKPLGGTRLMAEPNGNNPSIMWQSAGLPATCVIWKHMLGSQRLNGCRLAVMDDQSGAGLRYSRSAPETAWVK